MLKKYILLHITLFLLSVNCLPERDNPADPKSLYKHINSVLGRVITKVGNPIINAKITINFIKHDYSISTYSNENGDYNLQYLYSYDFGDSLTIDAIKDKYVSGVKNLQISANRSDTINFILDAIPFFESESIISYHEASIYPGDIYNLKLSVKVNDQDGPGDIDSIFFIIPIFNIVRTMDYSPGNIYKLTLPDEVFPDTALENLIGIDCYFECLSKSGLRTRSSVIRLNRVIYEVPQVISPLGDTVSQYFNCTWHRCNFSYPYTFGVELYLLPTNNIPQIMHFKYDIPSSDTVYTILTNLLRGRYLWQVLVRDNFGNISKSYQTLFYLE